MRYHGDFGGTMYLAESNQWSVYHPIQDNGKVGGEMSMDLIALGGNNMDSKEVFKSSQRLLNTERG